MMRTKRTAREAVQRALSQVGTVEHPMGSNLTKYGKLYGWNGVAWCAIFIWWVLNHSAIALIVKTASCLGIENWARKKGILKPGNAAANLGDLVLFQMPGPNRTNHVGIVVKKRKKGDPVHCVEGNTGGTNPRAGGMVAATKRTQYIRYIVDMSSIYAAEPVKPKAAVYTLRRFLVRGSSGVAVEKLQKAVGAKVDGDFGPKTEKKVKAFQKKKGLEQDGIVGSVTAKALGWKWEG